MKRNVIMLMLVGLLVACVTINIYFPAAAAQEVADEIINDVWQLKEGKEANNPSTKNVELKGEAETEITESK